MSLSIGSLRVVLAKIASPKILFYALPWLMIILTAGTIAQKELGLYTAQHTYFSSVLFWLGPVPLPGGFLTLGAITISLACKFLFFSPWHITRAGTIITHFGILLLMIGGLFTAATQKEGFIQLREGETTSAISDYHARALFIRKNDEPWATIPFEVISAGQPLPVEHLPFQISVLETCNNCLPSFTSTPEGRKGFAGKVELLQKPPEKENEANMSGLTFSLEGAEGAQNGIYIAVEEIPLHPAIKAGEDTYSFVMGRAQEALPFSITLDDFQRDLHPGMDMARGFSSAITVQDDDISWPYLIRMNEPMRYRGYTFYQSSFSIRPDGEFSILSVVQNKGRLFPYISSVIIFIGLLTHIIVRKRPKTEKEAP